MLKGWMETSNPILDVQLPRNRDGSPLICTRELFDIHFIQFVYSKCFNLEKKIRPVKANGFSGKRGKPNNVWRK